MKRTFSTSFAAAAIFGLAACKGAGAESVKLVPDSATIIGGIDMKSLMSSKLYTDNKDKIEQGEAKEMLDAARGCKIAPEQFNGLVFGADPATEGVVVVVDAMGIGKQETLACMAEKIKEKAGKDPWTVEEQDGRKVLKMDDGVGYVVNDNMVAIASTGWGEQVKQLIKGETKAAVDGGLKDLYARARKDKTIWFAGKLPADAKQGLAGTPGEKVVDFSGDLHLGAGLTAYVAAGVPAPEDAKTLQDELQKKFDEFKGMGAAMGVPQGIIDSVKIGAANSTVTIELAISDADLKTLQERMMGMMGGMMGGGMEPPPPPMGDMPTDPEAGEMPPLPGEPPQPPPAGGAPPAEPVPPPAAPPAE